MADKLDRKRPFGQVIGDDKGRVYEQDGQYFVGTGEPWVDPDAPAKSGGSTKKTQPAGGDNKPPVEGGDQLNAQLNG